MRPRILIVDDQPLVLDVLKEILSRGPYDVMAAPSGEEALELLAHDPIDVVISDERMPGMQGSEFLALVRQRHPDTIRIILTGHASVDAAIRAINEGEIFRFLKKPVNSQDLHAAVKDSLAHKNAGKKAVQNVSLLESLEKQAPGITQVKRDEAGVIILDEDE